MATYKLLQDIEAEDHILGPFTFRQFVFGLIAVFLFWLCFFVTTKVTPFLLVIFLPPALFFGFFAMPFGRDQPTEVWALAKIRFWFKPRRRIWNQSGVKELVTITAPKREEPVLTDGLSQTEVKSRLKALANTLDSRGWAVKNVNINAFAVPAMVATGSDRLIDLDNIPQAVPDADISAADDIMDAASNPIAQQFDSMISQSAQARREQLVSQMNGQAANASQTQPQADYWFMNGSGSTYSQPLPAPQAATIDPAEEAALSSELKSKHAGQPTPYGNLRTLKPAESKPQKTSVAAPAKTEPPMTPAPDPAILSLANNDDLNVATLAHEAKRAKGDEKPFQDEVSISLR